MKRIPFPLVLAAMLLMSFTATAFAQGAVAPDDASLLDLLRPVVDAVKGGQWALGGSLGVIFLMAVAKRYIPESWKAGKFLHSDLGGMVSTFLFSFAGSLVIALTPTGATLGAAMAYAALKFAVAAIGGYTVLNQLAKALVASAWWADHAPAWLKSAVALVLAMIGSKAIAKAEKAGQDAVDANPPGGANAAAGEPASI